MRLFFALPCPDQVAARIVSWRDGLALDGSPVRAENLHVTLAFPGLQPADKLPELIRLAASIEAPSFLLQLDQLRCWADGLLHLAPGKRSGALLNLASQLQQKLDAEGFKLDQREYLPHLTLARNCTVPVSVAPPAFCWKVEEFALFHSQSRPGGVHYEALASWKLQLAE